MKATIDIPDELYRRVKAKSALQGQAVREVAVNLFRGWVAEGEREVGLGTQPNAIADKALPAWFGMARKYAKRVQTHDIAAVRESIAKGRARVGAEVGRT